MLPILGRLELLLMDAFMQYSTHVRAGQIQPRPADPNWRAASPKNDTWELLQELLSSRDFGDELRALPPSNPGYQNLRKALHQYRKMAQQGAWPRIPPGPVLRQGHRNHRVQLLRERLSREAYSLKASSRPKLFDADLKRMVIYFQRRHGLPPNGSIDQATHNALNVPLDERIAQIKTNMDRWRWLPRQLGDDYIMVNTAGYELVAYADEEPYLVMRVITGKPERPSPILGGQVSHIVINPTWVVPRKIATEDLLPKIQANPDYLQEKKLRVLTSLDPEAEEVDPQDIDWSSLNEGNFPFILRQEPGEINSLGRIKFVFLNDFAVFLHDTPLRHLFRESHRAFSSGCIRVEDPLKLAQFMLGEDSGWDKDELKQSITEGYSESINVTNSMPIYLVYWTAWAEPNQIVNFRKDIYEWDKIRGPCH